MTDTIDSQRQAPNGIGIGYERDSKDHHNAFKGFIKEGSSVADSSKKEEELERHFSVLINPIRD